MFKIDYNKLHKLENAFIMLEISERGVNPAETLDGTTLRINSSEGYKQGVFDEGHSKILEGAPYTETILNVFPGVNLASYHQRQELENAIEKDGETFEFILKTLYEEDDDETAFNDLVSILGGRFDLLSFLFFLKDCNKYLPLRSALFDEKFRILGIDSNLAGNCTWKKYQEYNEAIRAIQKDLTDNVNKNITILDAHSFIWVLNRIEEYIDSKIQVVEHKSFGKGKVVDFKDNNIVVKFGKEEKMFDKDWGFSEGHLKYIKVGFDIDQREEEKDNTKDYQRKKAYIVFRGNSYTKETSNYIWALKYDASGESPHYWERMTEVEPGDIIFQYKEGYIKAVSTAITSCYDEVRAIQRYSGERDNSEGRRIDLNTTILDDPILISDFKEIIIRYRRDKYSAFNKNGGANQGYLYELEPEIFNLFMKQVETHSPMQVESTTVLSEKALEVVEALLKLIANRQRVITYSELSNMTQSKPSPYYEMNGLLDSINKVCDSINLPHISAMVVNKNTGLPGEGFRQLCIDSFGYNPNLTTQEIFDSELDKIGKCDNWDKLAGYVGIDMPVDSEEESLPEEVIVEPGEAIIEGAKKTITINAYERDPKAKRICKNHYMKKYGRIMCQVCGFDFGQVYGPEYSNKIHIHHIVPVSEIGEKYVVDPINDLIPVCPNCHMVLHLGDGISVDELKKKLKQGTKQAK